jgi:phosphopantothenoylcysteine decarboxylase/phosphopantothenate--cysteine ligase
MLLEGKKILVGISGGIAAYKIPYLVRLLKKNGAEVRCMMTPASSSFVAPITLSTLSENPVAIDFYNSQTGEWTNHVEWALWADLMIFAPLTANSLAKMAHGFSDNFLLTTYLSAKCPIVVAPAMDLDMYQHPTTQQNMSRLEAMGCIVIPADSGFLASGLEGQGRMPEPETIFKHAVQVLFTDKRLSSKTVLITAGPTFEAIDPVRFIGNHSSGKMGYALAEAAANLGASVILVSGPVSLTISHPNIEVIKIQSADEMLSAVQTHWNRADLGIFAAAVADFKPNVQASQKIKKTNDDLVLTLVKNPDILTWASDNRTKQQIVGFALETSNGVAYATSKLQHKNLDAIVLNELGEPGVGFGVDTNSVKLIYKNNKIISFELQSKQQLAVSLLTDLMSHFYE